MKTLYIKIHYTNCEVNTEITVNKNENISNEDILSLALKNIEVSGISLPKDKNYQHAYTDAYGNVHFNLYQQESKQKKLNQIWPLMRSFSFGKTFVRTKKERQFIVKIVAFL